MTDFTPANYPPPVARAWKPKFRSIVIAIACAAVCTLLALTGQGDRIDALMGTHAGRMTLTGPCEAAYDLARRVSQKSVRCEGRLESGETVSIVGSSRTLPNSLGSTITVYSPLVGDTWTDTRPSWRANFLLGALTYILWALVLVLIFAYRKPVAWTKMEASDDPNANGQPVNSDAIGIKPDSKGRAIWTAVVLGVIVIVFLLAG